MYLYWIIWASQTVFQYSSVVLPLVDAVEDIKNRVKCLLLNGLQVQHRDVVATCPCHWACLVLQIQTWMDAMSQGWTACGPLRCQSTGLSTWPSTLSSWRAPLLAVMTMSKCVTLNHCDIISLEHNLNEYWLSQYICYAMSLTVTL